MTFPMVLGAVQGAGVHLIAILAFMAFPVLWCALVWSVAKGGGWQQLAEVYSIEQYPSLSIRKNGLQTIYLNKLRYKRAVNISYDDYGLYMYPIVPFRVGHALLSVPWEDVTVHPKVVSKRLFAFDFTRKLTFAQVPKVEVVFSKSLIEDFERFRGIQMI